MPTCLTWSSITCYTTDGRWLNFKDFPSSLIALITILARSVVVYGLLSYIYYLTKNFNSAKGSFSKSSSLVVKPCYVVYLNSSTCSDYWSSFYLASSISSLNSFVTVSTFSISFDSLLTASSYIFNSLFIFLLFISRESICFYFAESKSLS